MLPSFVFFGFFWLDRFRFLFFCRWRSLQSSQLRLLSASLKHSPSLVASFFCCQTNFCFKLVSVIRLSQKSLCLLIQNFWNPKMACKLVSFLLLLLLLLPTSNFAEILTGAWKVERKKVHTILKKFLQNLRCMRENLSSVCDSFLKFNVAFFQQQNA